MARGNTASLRKKNGQNFPEHRELERERTREEGRNLRQDPRAVLRRLAFILGAMRHH